MSTGIYGGSAIDQHLLGQLTSHQDSGDEDEEAMEEATDHYGPHIGNHPEHGFVFERGYGHPVLVEDWDLDGKTYELGGVKDARTYVARGKVLVKCGEVIKSFNPTKKKYERSFRQDSAFVAEEI